MLLLSFSCVPGDQVPKTENGSRKKLIQEESDAALNAHRQPEPVYSSLQSFQGSEHGYSPLDAHFYHKATKKEKVYTEPQDTLSRRPLDRHYSLANAHSSEYQSVMNAPDRQILALYSVSTKGSAVSVVPPNSSEPAAVGVVRNMSELAQSSSCDLYAGESRMKSKDEEQVEPQPKSGEYLEIQGEPSVTQRLREALETRLVVVIVVDGGVISDLSVVRRRAMTGFH